ncbi:MAG: hypothetical protein ACE5D7_09275, partial [Fidelibacterota bacterium]
MYALLGNTLLTIAYVFTIYALVAVILNIRNSDDRFLRSGKWAFIASSAMIIISTIVLIHQLMVSNFNIEYVAKYTSAETPAMFKFSGLWAGMEGSLLFWLFIMSLYIIFVIIQNRNRHPKLMP